MEDIIHEITHTGVTVVVALIAAIGSYLVALRNSAATFKAELVKAEATITAAAIQADPANIVIDGFAQLADQLRSQNYDLMKRVQVFEAIIGDLKQEVSELHTRIDELTNLLREHKIPIPPRKRHLKNGAI